MVSISVDCTPQEACRLITARTDDRSFVALLNEVMTVVLPGEPIPRAKADRVRMLVDAGARRLTLWNDALATTEGTKKCDE